MNQRGFSFIEILVVMGIIAVLAGLSVVAVNILAEKGPEMQTRNLLQKTQSSILAFKQHFSTHPPIKLKDLPRTVGDRKTKIQGRTTPENEGIETLYQALTYRGFTAGAEWEGGQLSNVDDDELKTAINMLNDPKLWEIKDAYEHPLVYIDNRSYHETTKTPLRYMNGNGDTFDVVAWRNEETGQFEQPQSFQLFSVGPDGEPNTEDDLKAWTLD